MRAYLAILSLLSHAGWLRMTSLRQTPLWRPTHVAFARAHTHASLQCGPPAAVSDAREDERAPIGLAVHLQRQPGMLWKHARSCSGFFVVSARSSQPPTPRPLALPSKRRIQHCLAGNGRKWRSCGVGGEGPRAKGIGAPADRWLKPS